MSEYTLNVPSIGVELSVPLTEEAYGVPYEFPLVIYKKGSKVDLVNLKLLEPGQFKVNVPQVCDDPIVIAHTLKSNHDILKAYQEALPTIDEIRRPWLVTRIVELTKSIKKDFIPLAVDASIAYPESITSSLILATHYRMNGNNDAAYIIARDAMRRPGFFWEKGFFRNLNEELSIVSFWVNDYGTGHKAAELCCLQPGVTDKNLARVNRYFYNKNLPVVPDVAKKYDIATRPTEDGTRSYVPLNPSVLRDEHGYFGTFRTVNYTVDKNSWNIYHPGRIINTVNYLLTFDDKMNITSKKELVWDDVKYPCPWTGIEDIRLIDRGTFTATIPEANPKGFPMQFFCHYDFETARVFRVTPMIKEVDRMEKNWLPFYSGDNLMCIYNYKPFTILTLNKDTGAILDVSEKNYLVDLTGFKGSATPIPYRFKDKEGWLFTVHETIQTEGAYQYLNRIAWMDEKFNLSYLSRLFRFDNLHQVEMITSVTTEGNNISFWTGVNDREVVRYVLSRDKVDALLEWVSVN